MTWPLMRGRAGLPRARSGGKGKQKEVMLEGFVGWPENYVRKYQKAGYWHGHLVGDIIDTARAQFPDRVALSFEGKHVTYVAMPDPVLGEKACLFAVPKGGEKVSLEELNNFLVNERRIAKFKLPERLELADQFPQTHVGKINKKELRRIIADKLKEAR